MSPGLDVEVPFPQGGRGESWFGRDSLEAVVRAERQIVLVRLLGLSCAALVGPFLFQGLSLLVLFIACAVAALECATFAFWIIPRHPEWLRNGIIATILDNILTASVIYFTGGLQSEMYLVYFLIAVLNAVRFGGRTALVSTAVAALSYAMIVLVSGAPADLATMGLVFFRVGFAATTAVFVGFVGDRAHAAEQELEAQAVQARHALSEATAALTSSLQLDELLGVAARGAAHLADALRAEVEAGPPNELQQYLWSAQRRQRRTGAYRRAEGPDGATLQFALDCGEGSDGVLRIVLPQGVEELDDVHRGLVRVFAERCGPSLANAWTYAAVQLQALVDPTTGLANHRRFKEYLDDQERELAPKGRPLSVLMMDLDMFKEFNDTFGHLAGDRALRRVGAVLQAVVGAHGLAARYGGDEFVAILPGVDAGAAAALGRGVMAGFAEAMKQRLDGLQPPMGLSIGVSTAVAGDGNYHTLVGRADLAMYLAKRSGGGVRAFADVDDSDPLRSLVGSIMTQLSKADLHALDATRGRGSASRARSRNAAGTTRTTEVVRTLITALRMRDPALFIHCRNVSRLCFRMARRLGLSEWETYDIGLAGLLHDIGKICVPDAILQKPDALDSAEMAVVHRHAVQGSEILSAVPSLANVARMVRHHHEHVDGSGYPDGLQGEGIPLASRIVLAADAYDAITADRPYRRGRSAAEAVRVLLQCQGTQFDRHVVMTLTTLLSELKAVEARRRAAAREDPRAALEVS